MYILTSTWLSCQAVPAFIVSQYNVYDMRVAIITTASEWKQHNKYSILAYDQWTSLGAKEVFFFDLQEDDIAILEAVDCIYVCGGNTYYLTSFTVQKQFKTAIEACVKKWWLYVWVSAGSILVWPTVGISRDDNTVWLTDMQWLNLVPAIISPHYTNETEAYVKQYELHTWTSVWRLSNNQALIYQKWVLTLISS